MILRVCNFLIFLTGLLTVSCVANQQDEKSTVSCSSGQRFDSIRRSCVSTAEAPRGQLKEISILEDSGANTINLPYEDASGNLADDCQITKVSQGLDDVAPTCACVGGICNAVITTDPNFFGISDFQFTIRDVEGTSSPLPVKVNVTPVDDAPVGAAGLTPPAFSEDTASLISLPFTDIDSDSAASSCSITNPSNLSSVFSCACSGSGCVATVTGAQDFFGSASFRYTVTVDGLESDPLIVSLSITGVEDVPVPGASTTVSTAEDSSINFTVNSATENDGDNPLVYAVVTSPLKGTLLNCMNLTGSDNAQDLTCTYIPNANSTGSDFITFSITDNNSSVSATNGLIVVDLVAINDPPLPVSFNTSGLTESSTSVPSDFTFTVPDALDFDDSSFSYSIVTSPSNGTLKDCMDLSGSSSSSDLTCTYSPNDGNTTGIGTASTQIIQDLTYTAKANGTGGNSIDIAYATSALDGFERVLVTGSSILVEIASGATTANDIISLIQGDTYSNSLVSVSLSGSNNNQISQSTTSLAGGTDGADFFTYKASDGTNDSVSPHGHVSIDVTVTNDSPAICEFSKFIDAPECGLSGCIATSTPVGSITPSATGLHFYDSSNAVCYISTGTSNTNWSIVTSHISEQEVNEKETVIIDSIRVDEGGGDSAEDSETIKFSTVTSSNTTLIPASNVKFFQDGTETGTNTLFGSASSEDLLDFKIKITPVAGQSGSSTISLVLEDDNGTPAQTSVSFTVTVNPVSAIHGGWENIQAQGPNVDGFAQIINQEATCNFSRASCDSGGECVGSAAPLTVVPDGLNAIFYDSTNKVCYFSTGLTAGDWTALPNQFCNVTSSDIEAGCGSAGQNFGVSCVGARADIENIQPSKVNNFYYDTTNDVCLRSISSASSGSGSFEVYDGTGNVTLDWDTFSVSGSGSISGYNVYRRISNVSGEITNSEFDFDAPINKSAISSLTTSYVDNGTNSFVAPAPKTVYFYTIRPIINNLPTQTNEIFSTIRVLVPPTNQNFVHQWIVNKRICELMNSNTDSNNNFRCDYHGPGERAGFYDLVQDLVVDKFESGCNYSKSPDCTGTFDGSCIGIGTPNSSITADTGKIFYDRNDGTCYINNSGGGNGTSWTRVTGSATVSESNYAHLPPLVFMGQEESHDFCGARGNLSNVLGVSSISSPKLPSRREQIAYSLWDPQTSDSAASTLEQGLSLNSSSKCNSTSASGLTGFFSDSEVPDSNTFFTIPGTTSSNIRSLETGSDKTLNCVTQFGIQDVIGNVSEWTSDRMTCSGAASCTAVVSGGTFLTDASADLDNITDTAAVFTGNFDFDGDKGPCSDTDGDGTCDGLMDSWNIQDERFDSGRFFLPMGLPADVNFPTAFAGSDLLDFALEIGPTSGITATQLRNDKFVFNTDVIDAAGDDCAGFVTGGSFNSSSGAGSYYLEFNTCGDSDGKNDIGMRCVHQVTTYDEAP
jgi:trimeric autotransporter adhesin